MTATKPWNENEELFAAQVALGHRFALQVGARLLETGHSVQVTPLKLRTSLAEVPDYADEEDIVLRSASGAEFVVESKSRNLEFGPRPEDYPYATAFASRTASWDRLTRRPGAIVLTSQITGAMLVIPGRTSPRWLRERGHDGLRNIDSEWYMAPRGLLRPMGDLIRWLTTDWPTP